MRAPHRGRLMGLLDVMLADSMPTGAFFSWPLNGSQVPCAVGCVFGGVALVVGGGLAMRLFEQECLSAGFRGGLSRGSLQRIK
mmetsp:Transcript_17062/g.33535  ORF Transcript_17062/g.33535 Transcript_17062/m.33535 type:complete len:83 (+) Transcript_17062:128-376(+)